MNLDDEEPATMKAIHRKRLLNVSRALRESPNPDDFTMDVYAHACGTPACALGHYAARRDLQRTFLLDRFGDLDYSVLDMAKNHFGLTSAEASELFSLTGCGGAKTTEQAARYIEKFVEKAA